MDRQTGKSQLKENNCKINRLIDESLALLQDKKIDYHIMNIERLLKAEVEDKKDEVGLTFERKDRQNIRQNRF